jgi:hypothetical protein
MGFAATAQVIRERFATQWATLQPNIPYTFDNQGQDDADFPTRDTPWVRLIILDGEGQQVEMGMKGRWRRPGLVVVQVFVPAGDGDGLSAELCDTVRDVFEGRTISGVIFRATSRDRAGRGRDSAWMRWDASTPFQADELR